MAYLLWDGLGSSRGGFDLGRSVLVLSRRAYDRVDHIESQLRRGAPADLVADTPAKILDRRHGRAHRGVDQNDARLRVDVAAVFSAAALTAFACTTHASKRPSRLPDPE